MDGGYEEWSSELRGGGGNLMEVEAEADCWVGVGLEVRGTWEKTAGYAMSSEGGGRGRRRLGTRCHLREGDVGREGWGGGV